MFLSANIKPLVSVIVPVYNEEKHLLRCLETLLSQKTDLAYEVLVVDGMSSDGSYGIAQVFFSRHPNLHLFRNTNRVIPAGLNIGLRSAQGRFILRADAHSYYPEDFLEKNYRTFESISKKETKLVAVGGRWQCGNKGDYGQIAFIAANSFFGGGISEYHYSQRPRFVSTIPHAFYIKDKLLGIGSFDETYGIGEDAEINWRLIKSGSRLYYDPKIISYYHARDSIRPFTRQIFNYGLARWRLIEKHPDSFRLVYLLPLLVIISFIIAPLGLMNYLLIFPLACYLMASAFFSVWEFFINNRKVPIGEISVAYAVIHLAYGSGFLFGLLSYLFRVFRK